MCRRHGPDGLSHDGPHRCVPDAGAAASGQRCGNDPHSDPHSDEQHKIANTRDLLASLPPDSWFKCGEELHHDHKAGDAGIYDLLLHSQDRSYSVDELFDWRGSDGHGLHLAFSDVQRGRSPYLPHMVLGSNRGQPFMLRHQHSGVSAMVNPGKYGAKILRRIDGQKSFGEIFGQFRADWQGQAAAPDNATLFADFAESYDTLNALERLLLKHPDANG